TKFVRLLCSASARACNSFFVPGETRARIGTTSRRFLAGITKVPRGGRRTLAPARVPLKIVIPAFFCPCRIKLIDEIITLRADCNSVEGDVHKLFVWRVQYLSFIRSPRPSTGAGFLLPSAPSQPLVWFPQRLARYLHRKQHRHLRPSSGAGSNS